MKLFNTISDLQNHLNQQKANDNTIGFVPTMGALHQGHLSLLKEAKKENNICICSVFVNPTQFNNPEDLTNYPRNIEQDIKLLEQVGCDILFNPEVTEMYPPNFTETLFDFGIIETVMEGADRPGHFQGVGTIVKRLFEIIEPNKAYFGKKDYQQLLIIKSLTKQFNLSPQIIGCEIIREQDGLAMSSRNQRLSNDQRNNAPWIYTVLQEARKLSSKLSVSELKNWVKEEINNNEFMSLNYFEISDAQNLSPIKEWNKNQRTIGFIVVNMGDIRLIDNIELF